MRGLMMTAAALAVTSTGAIAEQHMPAETAGEQGEMTMDARREMHSSTAMDAMPTEEFAQARGDLIRTRDITGGNVYTTNEADDEGWDANVVYDEVAGGWNQIGEIEDIVLSRDGQVIGIVAEIGGFLDIGDRHVVLSVSDLNLVAVDGEDYAYVTRFNEEQLENLPDVDEGFWE